jgi:tRNA (adenine57-N1/adenine58-N1)-methyltransferase
MSKIIIDKKNRRHFWKSGDLHIEEGTIKEKEIKRKCSKVSTHLGKILTKFDSKFPDIIHEFKTGPAIIIPKDIGTIISNTGVNSKSKIVDAGTGSGILAAHLSNITDNVTTYEANKKHFKIAKANLKKISSKAKIKNEDISKGIKEKNLDLITLDLPNPDKILSHATKSLKSGAYLVCYLPNITQVQELLKSAKNHQFILEKITETLEREWTINDKICRPKHQMLGHTAFLVFFRKY